MKFVPICMKNILEYARISWEFHSEECGRHTLGVWLELLKEYISGRHSPLETSSWGFEAVGTSKQLELEEAVSMDKL